MHLKITKKSFAEAEFDKMQIVIEEGKNFVVRTEHLEKRPRVSVQYEIDLPASVDLADVITSNGSIKLNGTSGDASVIASNGSIEVKDHTGDINARTSNGKIEADNLEGSIEAATSNGRIDLEGIAGSASANTSNGSIDISGCKLITEARTSNARIELEIVEMNDDLDVVTSNGKVILEISAHLNADLTASTNNSKIIWDHPRLNTEIVKNNYVKGKLGAGGYHLDIRTSNANIYLESLEELF